MRMRFIPSRCISCSHRPDSNWEPRSVVTVEGTPNRAIQVVAKASATVSAVMLAMGMASGQRVKRSIHVKRYE